MNKSIELNLACYKLAKAIRNGNRILTESDYDKKWNDYRLHSQKLRNLKKRA